MEQFAPLSLQDSYDNAGMQVGEADAEARGALLCIDVTEEVLDEAVANGCNLVISHHPLIFKGIKSVTGKTYVERCIRKAIKSDVAIYAAHTNLDNAFGGVNYKMAEKIGLKNIRALQPAGSMLVKLVTFVPVAHAENVRRALFAAGCGDIGNYKDCSYSLEGEGTFFPKEGAHPHCGTVGRPHAEREVRIETVFPAYREKAVRTELFKAHPYEEPVVDLYTLQNTWERVGSGIVGELESPEAELEFLQRVKALFGVASLGHSKLTGRTIQRVALCGGAGAFLLPCAIRAGVDAFLTGEIKYHDFFGNDEEILLARLGHYESEQYTKEIFYSVIRNLFPTFALKFSEINTNPIKYL